jgi:hypothetical protein
MLISLLIAIALTWGRWRRRAKPSPVEVSTARFPFGAYGPTDAPPVRGGVYEGHATDDP